MKQNPVKYEEAKAKDRLRKQKAKEDGKIKPLSELPPRQQRLKRKAKREYMRQYRLRKKEEESKFLETGKRNLIYL